MKPLRVVTQVGQRSFLMLGAFGTLLVLLSVIMNYSELTTQVPSPWQSNNSHHNVVHTQLISLLSTIPSGRLGNEMFEYAALLGLANATNRKPVIDNNFQHIHKPFKLSVNITQRNDSAMTIYNEPKIYDVEETVARLKNISADVILNGYFQSHRYFTNIKEQIRREFTFRDNIIDSVKKYFNDSGLSIENVTKIGIHIRRTDLAEPRWIQAGFGPPEISYYKNAMEYFRVKYGRVRFVICSDDIEWVRTHLNASDVTLVTGNLPEVDFAILASCDHIIVGNGTFGWWAGWLCLGTTVYYKGMPKEGSDFFKIVNGDNWPSDDKFNHYVPVDDK